MVPSGSAEARMLPNCRSKALGPTLSVMRTTPIMPESNNNTSLTHVAVRPVTLVARAEKGSAQIWEF